MDVSRFAQLRCSGIRWGPAFGFAALAEVLLIIPAVVYFSLSGDLSQEAAPALYQRHTRLAGPWLLLPLGMALFYWMARWRARRDDPQAAMSNALAFWFAWAQLDLSFLLAADGAKGMVPMLPFWIASLTTKLLSVWVGASLPGARVSADPPSDGGRDTI